MEKGHKLISKIDLDDQSCDVEVDVDVDADVERR